MTELQRLAQTEMLIRRVVTAEDALSRITDWKDQCNNPRVIWLAENGLKVSNQHLAQYLAQFPD